MKAILNGPVIMPEGILHHHAVIFDDRIKGIVSEEELVRFPVTEQVDAQGRYVSPGFIDVHVHGCHGFDTMDEEEEALTAIREAVLQTGVTAFLPTTMTMPFPRIKQSLEHIRKAMKEGPGAEVLGCHMEGPFIQEAYKGAQDKTYITGPDMTQIAPYLDCIKIITIAPEAAGSKAFIQECVQKGIVVSMGHSGATYEQGIEAIQAGVSHMTHTFNALPPLHHRLPGAVGAALDSEIFCELIADNFHVHPAMQRILLKVKGLDKIILITDAMRASLLGNGEYDLGGQMVTVQGGEARLPGGVIAGSILTLNRAVRNFMNNTGICLADAVRMVTLNPARQVNVEQDRGSIALGKQADLILFDKEIEVSAVFVRGNLVFGR